MYKKYRCANVQNLKYFVNFVCYSIPFATKFYWSKYSKFPVLDTCERCNKSCLCCTTCKLSSFIAWPGFLGLAFFANVKAVQKRLTRASQVRTASVIKPLCVRCSGRLRVKHLQADKELLCRYSLLQWLSVGSSRSEFIPATSMPNLFSITRETVSGKAHFTRIHSPLRDLHVLTTIYAKFSYYCFSFCLNPSFLIFSTIFSSAKAREHYEVLSTHRRTIFL